MVYAITFASLLSITSSQLSLVLVLRPANACKHSWSRERQRSTASPLRYYMTFLFLRKFHQVQLPFPLLPFEQCGDLQSSLSRLVRERQGLENELEKVTRAASEEVTRMERLVSGRRSDLALTQG